MRFFRRRRSQATDEVSATAEEIEDARSHDLAQGPWDVADQAEIGQRVDVGALRVPARKGMQMRMELEPKTRRIVAINLVYQGTAVQLQAFAAPRSEGIWEDLREEIGESISKQGGSTEEREGMFGSELLARLPVRTKDGRAGVRPVRFLGVDGERWFLRAVVSGKGAVEAAAVTEIDELISDIVVVRGSDPRPPRELLPLHLPGKAGEVSAPTRSDLDIEGRGPEITEVG